MLRRDIAHRRSLRLALRRPSRTITMQIPSRSCPRSAPSNQQPSSPEPPHETGPAAQDAEAAVTGSRSAPARRSPGSRSPGCGRSVAPRCLGPAEPLVRGERDGPHAWRTRHGGPDHLRCGGVADVDGVAVPEVARNLPSGWCRHRRWTACTVRTHQLGEIAGSPRAQLRPRPRPVVLDVHIGRHRDRPAAVAGEVELWADLPAPETPTTTSGRAPTVCSANRPSSNDTVASRPSSLTLSWSPECSRARHRSRSGC